MANARRMEHRMAPVFDDSANDPIEERKVRMRASKWRQIRAIAEVEKRSVNEVATYFLEWAVGDWSSLTSTEKVTEFRAELTRIEERERKPKPSAPMALPKRAKPKK